MEMGLLSEGITEVIAVTKDNAAPIGIIVKPGRSPKMILYKGSKTAENVVKYGWVTANFVSDAYLYTQYAFTDVQAENLRPVFVGGSVMQILVESDAWMAFRTRVVNETKDAYYIELVPVASEFVRDQIRPVNRGFNSVIDATVHATRYVITHDGELLKMILYHLDIVRKCGGQREQEAAELIKKVCGI